MPHAPPLSAFASYPVAGGTCLAAIAIAILENSGYRLDPLIVSHRVHAGEIHRLLTSALVHDGFFHLIFNLYWTWTLGALAEHKYGSLRTLLIFLLLALVSSGLEFAFLQGGVGLSGVVYGLFGLFWAQRLTDGDARLAADRNTTYTFFGWFLICCVGSWLGTMHIANIAHGMGFVAGASLGKAISAVRHRHRLYYRIATGVLVPLTLVLATVARPYVNLSNHWWTDLVLLAVDEARRGNNAAATATLARINKGQSFRKALRIPVLRGNEEDPARLDAKDLSLPDLLQMIGAADEEKSDVATRPSDTPSAPTTSPTTTNVSPTPHSPAPPAPVPPATLPAPATDAP